MLNYFYKSFNDTIMPIAESKSRKYVTEIINNSTDNIKFENDLFVIEKSNDNEIKMITYNSYEATKLINIYILGILIYPLLIFLIVFYIFHQHINNLHCFHTLRFS